MLFCLSLFLPLHWLDLVAFDPFPAFPLPLKPFRVAEVLVLIIFESLFSRLTLIKKPVMRLMTCFSLLCGRRVESASTCEGDEELSGINNVKQYSFKELSKATKDFDPANKIGEGGFGSVYKGKLKDGKLIAIKVLSAQSQQGIKEFMTEIKSITDIEHENFVKLYGCCIEQNHRILVYNYMENNSLSCTLLSGVHCGFRFDWGTRSRICVGVARGLAFLHETLHPHIIHRDIKASNILLDQDLTPKIADFGLAKLFPSNVTHISTCVAGTLGYLAPEYAIRGRLTRKADIYSFGVLLIEVVCGRCNTNTRLPVGERYLLEQTWEHYKRRELVVLVDRSLEGHVDPQEACRYLKIGLLCTQDFPKLRPSMSTVVKMLTGEIDVDNIEVTEPGIISDLMDLKVQKPEDEISERKASGIQNTSSSSDNIETSNASSGASTFSVPTFTV